MTFKLPVSIPKDINRLIGSWYPTGKILFQDDMEDLIADATNHYKNTAGTTSKANDRAYSKQYSLKLTTGNVAGNAASVALYLGLPNYLTRLGLELKWLSNADLANLRSFKVAMTRYDGSTAYFADLRYYGTFTTSLHKWQYLNSSNGLTDLLSQYFSLSTTEPAWNGLKIIADFQKNCYDSFWTNQYFNNMKNIPFYTVASAVQPELGIYIEIVTETATAINAWLDDLILTDEG